MTRFSDIPFSFLASWSKENRTLSPALGYVGTLAAKGTFHTVNDLFTTPGKPPKRLSDLRNSLSALKDVLEKDYAMLTSTAVIPAVPSGNTDQMISAFMQEYRLAKEARTLSSQKQHAARKVKLSVLKAYFLPEDLSSGNPSDMHSIAVEIGLSQERVRQLKQECISDCRRIFSGETVDGISASPAVTSWYSRVSGQLPDTMSYASFKRICGISGNNPHLERFILELLDMEKSGDKQKGDYISKGSRTAFNRSLGKVITFFRKKAIPAPAAELQAFLGDNIQDAGLRKALYDYANNSEEFESGKAADGTSLLALRWDKLLFLPSEIARILYDNDVWTIKDSWYKEDVIKEYNRRAGALGRPLITPETAGMLKHPLLMPLGKTGYIKLSEGGEDFSDGQEFALQYVLANPDRNSLGGFLEVCSESGHLHIYQEHSLTTFYYNALTIAAGKSRRAVVVGRNEEILRASCDILRESGKPVRVSELKRQSEKRIGARIPDPTFRQLLQRVSGKVFRLTYDGPRRLMVSLIEGDAAMDLSLYNRQFRRAAYKEDLMEFVKDELRKAGGRLPLRQLAAMLKDRIPSDIAKTNVYKIFNDSDVFTKTYPADNPRDVYVELNDFGIFGAND